jgi:hypothetical protein
MRKPSWMSVPEDAPSRRGRFWLFAIVGIALIIGVPLFIWVQSGTHTVRSRVLVSAKVPKIIFDTRESDTDYPRYQQTQIAWVKTAWVLKTALLAPKVAEYRLVREQHDPVAWLQEKLSVGFIGDSEVMEIALKGAYPEELAGIVNAVTKAYLDEVVYESHKQRTYRFDQLKKIKENYTELLKKKREMIRRLAESVGSNDRDALAYSQQLLMSQVTDEQKRLFEVRHRIREIKARLEVAKDAKEAPKPETLAQLEQEMLVLLKVETELQNDVKELRQKITDLNVGTIDLEAEKDEYELQRAAAAAIGKELEALKVELEAPPRIKLMDEASAPEKP